jgi:HTH-type transcriptional regulator/antitoxin HipB
MLKREYIDSMRHEAYRANIPYQNRGAAMAVPITTSGQLAPLLQRLRKNQGLSQAGLGERLGLSQERISRIERFPERVTLDQLLTVLMALDAEFQVAPRQATSKARGKRSGEEW